MIPKIAIIGGGLGGLTLARLLQENNISCTIYEGEQDRFVRNQGGTLDLHPEAGQQALREAGLLELFHKYSRPEGQADKIVTFDGEVLWNENDIDQSLLPQSLYERPEIDRRKLRDIFLDSIDTSTIQWNRRVACVEKDPQTQDKFTIQFVDGSKETGIDLVVGADGAWSKVRPLVTDEKPFYSGISAVELWALDVEQKYKWLSKYVGNGSCFMFDEGRAIVAQRNGSDSIRVYACVKQPEAWKDECGIDWSNHDAARRALVREYFDDCSDELKHVVPQPEEELVVRQMYMLPVGMKWASCPGVTLIGDAAHLMTPFAGVGVTVAMTDALVLARSLIRRKDNLDSSQIAAAVEDYEEFMFDYARKNAEKTAKGLEMHFSRNGGKDRARRFISHFEQETGKKYVPVQ